MWKYSYLVHFRSFFGQVVNIQTFSRKCHFYFRFKMAAVFKLPFKWPLTVVLAMAPYPIFLSALKTVIMPIFVLLTESEQFKHISALLKDVLSSVTPWPQKCWLFEVFFDIVKVDRLLLTDHCRSVFSMTDPGVRFCSRRLMPWNMISQYLQCWVSANR